MQKSNDKHIDLTKRPLSFTEAAQLANNLEVIEYHRKLQQESAERSAQYNDAPLPLIGKIMYAIIILALLYGFGSIFIATILAIISSF